MLFFIFIVISLSFFRYLDPYSLLSTVKTFKRCKEVCLGDPILRRRLKVFLKQKKEADMEKRMNPALAVTITREEPERAYGTNVMKNVKKKSTERREPVENYRDIFSKRPRTKRELLGRNTNSYKVYRL